MDPSELLDRRVPDLISSADLRFEAGSEVDWLAGRFEAWTESGRDVGVRARALVQAARPDDARTLLESGVDELSTTQGWVAAAWAASRTGPGELAAHLLGHEPALNQTSADREEFLFEGDVPLGPRSLSVGLLKLASGHHEDAVEELSRAVMVADMRGPAWGARARMELGRALSDGSGLNHDDAARAVGRRALISAQTFFAASGYLHLAAVTTGLIDPSAGSSPGLTGSAAAPWLGHLVPGSPWTIGYGVAPPVNLSASRGLAIVRELVGRRHEQVSTMELDRIDTSPRSDGSTEARGQDRPDVEALVADGASVDDLRDQLFDDRTRSKVSKLVRRTIERIAAVHPLLGGHLRTSIKTGHYCCYDGSALVCWRLDNTGSFATRSG